VLLAGRRDLEVVAADVQAVGIAADGDRPLQVVGDAAGREVLAPFVDGDFDRRILEVGEPVEGVRQGETGETLRAGSDKHL
jgi:hypothetical protein